MINTLAPHLQVRKDGVEEDIRDFLMLFWGIGGVYQVDVLSHYCNRRGIDPGKGSTRFLEDARGLSEADRMDIFRQSARDAGILFQDSDMEYLMRTFDVLKQNIRAETRFTPKPSEDRVVIFSAEQNAAPENMDDQPTLMNMLRTVDYANPMSQHPTRLGWDNYCGNIETHKVPGSHFSMLHPPNVRVLARKLKQLLCS